jgi:cell division topological specificity factor
MSFLFDKIFSPKQESSAKLAKDRLKIVLAHERVSSDYPFMNDLKRDILQVIKKYIEVKDINIKSEKSSNMDMLEVEVILDDGRTS